MSHFINLRAGSYGAVAAPYVLTGDPLSDPPVMASLPYESIGALVQNKDVLLATHGFNVSYVEGLRALGRLEIALALKGSEIMFGVLWPGDWVVPAINYPFEEKVAAHAGQLLGDFCNRWLTGVRSIALASHSLGARVVLETVLASKRKVRSLCITAGAVSADCLSAQYQLAATNCERVAVLASDEDTVLSEAYPVGDLVADILDLDHKPFERALGLRGPEMPTGPVVYPAQIPDTLNYSHGDYLPPSNLAQAFPDPLARWSRSVGFIAREFRGEPHSWP